MKAVRKFGISPAEPLEVKLDRESAVAEVDLRDARTVDSPARSLQRRLDAAYVAETPHAATKWPIHRRAAFILGAGALGWAVVIAAILIL